jgi:hypothetical protein
MNCWIARIDSAPIREIRITPVEMYQRKPQFATLRADAK